MKKIFPCLITVIALPFVAAVCNAQSFPPVQLALKQPPANVAVDANLKEWGDSLSYYSPEERLNYTIANSKDTLYLAVKIVEKTEIARVLNAGLTFSINTKGKDKATYSLTFPINTQGSNSLNNIRMGDTEDSVTNEQREQLLSERITSLRGIKQTGFNKDIEDDMITTSNTYGIQASFDYDAMGNLVYEEAIPLKFFHADGDKGLWAFNIKINGIQRPANTGGDSNGGGSGGGGGRHGGGGGAGGRHGGGGHNGGSNSTGSAEQDADRAELSKSIDFWGKFSLAR
jgi:hypothetical protein